MDCCHFLPSQSVLEEQQASIQTSTGRWEHSGSSYPLDQFLHLRASESLVPINSFITRVSISSLLNLKNMVKHLSRVVQRVLSYRENLMRKTSHGEQGSPHLLTAKSEVNSKGSKWSKIQFTDLSWNMAHSEHSRFLSFERNY